MKVAFDQQIFVNQVYGGVSRYFCELATNLSSTDNIDVRVVAPMYVNSYLKNIPEETLLGFSSPMSHWLLNNPRKLVSKAMSNMILNYIKPDIIHETYYLEAPAGSNQTTRVITLHDMIHEKFREHFHSNDKTIQNKKAAINRADHIICVSESTKRDAIEMLGIRPEKISVVHLGFHLMQDSNKLQSKKITDLNIKPYLLYVGSRKGYKNFQRLLMAYAESSMLKSEFNLICFGGGKFNNQELSLFSKLNLTTMQVIQQSGNDEVLAKLYKNASIFVYPSLYEGFGIPPLEAMSYGCPVVCSNVSSIPEVVGDAGYYINPMDINNIKTSIEDVLNNQEIKNTLISKGEERLNHFSWQKCANQTYEVYKDLT